MGSSHMKPIPYYKLYEKLLQEAFPSNTIKLKRLSPTRLVVSYDIIINGIKKDTVILINPLNKVYSAKIDVFNKVFADILKHVHVI